MKLNGPRVYKVFAVLNYQGRSYPNIVDMVYIERIPNLVFQWIEEDGEERPKVSLPVAAEDLSGPRQSMDGSEFLLRPPVDLPDWLAEIALAPDEPPPL
jgi:hypothetical protein